MNMKNLKPTIARSQALNKIEDYVDLSGYMFPEILLNEFKDEELLNLSNIINDKSVLAVFKEGLDVSEEIISTDSITYKLAYMLDNGEISPGDADYSDAVSESDYIAKLNVKYESTIALIKDCLTKVCDEPLFDQVTKAKAA